MTLEYAEDNLTYIGFDKTANKREIKSPTLKMTEPYFKFIVSTQK